MSNMINHGLYRTADNSYVMFRWRRTGYRGKPFAEFINIVTGDSWFMSMSKPRTQRYLSRLVYCGAKVRCPLWNNQSYVHQAHADFSRGRQ